MSKYTAFDPRSRKIFMLYNTFVEPPFLTNFDPEMEKNDRLCTDKSLAKELKKGSVKAFDTIYRRYARAVYSYCFTCTKSSLDAEEIVQDVFVNLWRYHRDIDPDKSLRVLIFTIARRYCINAFRSIVGSKVYSDYLDYRNELASDGGPVADIEYGEFLQAVRRALEQLPQRYRSVIEMSRIDQIPHEEIAARFGVTVKTVRNIQSIALKLLKNELKHFLPVSLALLAGYDISYYLFI